MIKVKIEKENNKKPEFIKETKLQVIPNKGDIIEIDDKLYVAESIKHSTDFVTITVFDKKKPRGLVSF